MKHIFRRILCATGEAAGIFLTGGAVGLLAHQVADAHVAYKLALGILTLAALVSTGALFAILLAPDEEPDEEPHCPHGVEWEYCPQCRYRGPLS